MHTVSPESIGSQPSIKNTVFDPWSNYICGCRNLRIQRANCIFIEKNPQISTPALFKLMLFNGQP